MASSSYKTGYVYIISCINKPSVFYIGSTFMPIRQRFYNHKMDYRRNNNSRKVSLYKYFEEYGVDNFKCNLLKAYDVYREHNRDHRHLFAYETLWINKMRGCVNKNLPFNPLKKIDHIERNRKYRENNKDIIKQKDNKYYHKNKDIILEKKRIKRRAKKKINS